MKNTSNQLVTMSTLGKRGRFGNQVFQYAFLKIYTSQYSLGLETGQWVGQFLFGHQDPRVTHVFPVLENKKALEAMRKNLIFSQKTPPFVNVDFERQFMVHTKFYRPYKSFFRSLFRPVPEIFEKVNKGFSELRRRGKTIIGIHIRRGDFLNYPNHPRNIIVPTNWYKKWLDQIWPKVKEPVLFIASDDLDSVLPDFIQYRPVTSSEVVKNFAYDKWYYPHNGRNMRISKRREQNRRRMLNPSFYPDFYFLTQCDILAICNSSFSFAAGLLNEKGRTFMRPHPSQQLVPYNPWNSPVRLSFPVKE